MQCSKCKFENRDDAKYCGECGHQLGISCPKCGAENRAGNKFCDECGCKLEIVEESFTENLEKESLAYPYTPEESTNYATLIEGERKHVTILFSDLAGYTAMSEKLDPEEVKEITTHIFDKISKIISKYGGFVEKYAGDAVMALFGADTAHEDDPVRAVQAAREVHHLVDSLDPEYEGRIDQPLSMHTGINTGLVVTGEVNLQKGTHGVAGDAINVAARLSGLAQPGEIVVTHETCRMIEGYFHTEEQGPTRIKGKKEPMRLYKIISPRAVPKKVHRLHGLRAHLVGRKSEMYQLEEAVERLMKKKGSIVSICGDAGTGKSRLVEEFKSNLDLDVIQWREGHAYAYSQNSPYAIVIDLLNRAFQIEEADSPETLKKKLESGIAHLTGNKEDITPYIGSLYSLNYPEVEDVSPEFWKARLQEGMDKLVADLSLRAPTIICLEDLHWADPSSVDLVRYILVKSSYPALFVCVYRPAFSLFSSHQLATIGEKFTEILLKDLSPSETQEMATSLLNSETIPSELRIFIQKKIGGNPFYMEEALNSLIEMETLARVKGEWMLTKAISDADIPSTIQGVLAARLDRLGKETRRVLQEASVIGRTFFYDILNMVTELKTQIGGCLNKLERLDLIRTKAFEPELEYIFKHALTQDAVYNGLLIRDRKILHERIGQAMEHLFQDRLAEFYEILAYHFSRGKSLTKAVAYLMNSGEKSLYRFALEEAHNYYLEAFNLLNNKAEKLEEDDELLVEVILKWALVFNHRGDFKGLSDLLISHEHMSARLKDKHKLGMFYAWLGFAIWIRGKTKSGYDYLIRALSLGEEIGDNEVLGYACTWLGWACWDLGLLEEGINFGKKAQSIQRRFIPENHYMHFSSLGAIGHICSATGDSKLAFETANAHLEYGRRHSNVRSNVFGHIDMGFGHFVIGDFPSAIESFLKAVKISPDPFFVTYARFWLGASYLLQNQVDKSETELKKVLDFSRTHGTEVFEASNIAFLGVVKIVKGRLSEGLKMIEYGVQKHLKDGRKSLYALLEHTLGKVFLQIATGEGPKDLSFMLRNIGFIVKNVPLARRKAEDHLKKSIEVSKQIGANYSLSLALMDLGRLYLIKKENQKAEKCLSESTQILEKNGAEFILKQVREIVLH